MTSGWRKMVVVGAAVAALSGFGATTTFTSAQAAGPGDAAGAPAGAAGHGAGAAAGAARGGGAGSPGGARGGAAPAGRVGAAAPAPGGARGPAPGGARGPATAARGDGGAPAGRGGFAGGGFAGGGFDGGRDARRGGDYGRPGFGGRGVRDRFASHFIPRYCRGFHRAFPRCRRFYL